MKRSTFFSIVSIICLIFILIGMWIALLEGHLNPVLALFSFLAAAFQVLAGEEENK